MITKRLIKAGEELSVKVVDGVIIRKDGRVGGRRMVKQKLMNLCHIQE